MVHPLITCGLCRACRAGDDMHCENSAFPGIDSDGGMAQLLRTSARSCVKLDPVLQPKDIAALADAGLTAYHAVRKSVPHLYAGTKAVVIGAGAWGTSASSASRRLPPPRSSSSTRTRRRSIWRRSGAQTRRCRYGKGTWTPCSR